MRRHSAGLKKFFYNVIGKANGEFNNVNFVVEDCILIEKDIIAFA